MHSGKFITFLLFLMYLINLDAFVERVQSSVRLKFGFGIGNRNQGPISVSEPNIFFPKRKLFFSIFFQIFSCFSASYENLGF